MTVFIEDDSLLMQTEDDEEEGEDVGYSGDAIQAVVRKAVDNIFVDCKLGRLPPPRSSFPDEMLKSIFQKLKEILKKFR